jgi:hypothetical protein
LIVRLCAEFARFVGGGRLFALNVKGGTDERSGVGEISATAGPRS